MEAVAPDNNDSTFSSAVDFATMVIRDDIAIEKKEMTASNSPSKAFFNNVISPEIISKLGSPEALRNYLTVLLLH